MQEVVFKRVPASSVFLGEDIAAGRPWVWAVYKDGQFILAARTKLEAQRRYRLIDLHSAAWWKETG